MNLRMSSTIPSDIVLIRAAERMIKDQLDLIEDQQSTLDQIIRAIDDLSLTRAIGRRLIANLGLDIMGIGQDCTGAPTLRAPILDNGNFDLCG